jgi:hypothetical protein
MQRDWFWLKWNKDHHHHLRIPFGINIYYECITAKSHSANFFG